MVDRYEFTTRWRLAGQVREVADVMFDVPAAARWCPSVYRRAVVVRGGEPSGLGTVVELRAAARVGYTLTFRLQVTEIDEHRCAFVATGDLAGDGEWVLTQFGDDVEVRVHWRVGVTRPWMRGIEPVLRPFFVANHNWAMETSRRGLLSEVARRRAAGPEPVVRRRPAFPLVAVGFAVFGYGYRTLRRRRWTRR